MIPLEFADSSYVQNYMPFNPAFFFCCTLKFKKTSGRENEEQAIGGLLPLFGGIGGITSV